MIFGSQNIGFYIVSIMVTLLSIMLYRRELTSGLLKPR